MNRRQHVRRTFPGSTATVQFSSDASTSPESVQPMDVSASGLRLIYHRAIAVASECSLIIRARSGQWMRVRGTVCRCDEVAGTPGQWDVGLQFHSPIAIDELLETDQPINVVEKAA